ncbi:hypothetical protein RclHR1_01350003 [Rhizophagus clarus]|uniref:Uncharacterized protein n=1 Tax=Rhizophagus clarus TaxID=94130 RepID=A0A2Z6R2I2_9GLOM|nr:hypothetical protein RclHR1_01350003 [Rhizophagus clarus]
MFIFNGFGVNKLNSKESIEDLNRDLEVPVNLNINSKINPNDDLNSQIQRSDQLNLIGPNSNHLYKGVEKNKTITFEYQNKAAEDGYLGKQLFKTNEEDIYQNNFEKDDIEKDLEKRYNKITENGSNVVQYDSVHYYGNERNLNFQLKLEDYDEEIETKIPLSNEPSTLDGKENTIHICNEVMNKVQDLRKVISRSTHYEFAEINDDSIRNSFESLNNFLEANQDEISCNKMVEFFVNYDDCVASWIQLKLVILKDILNEDDLSKDNIYDFIKKFDDVEITCKNAFCFANILANKLIEEMTNEIEQNCDNNEDIKTDLELVRVKQRGTDSLREGLLEVKYDLEQARQTIDFEEKVNEILNDINDIFNVIANSLVQDITYNDMEDWRIKLNHFEQRELFSLTILIQKNMKETFCAFNNRKSKELEGLLKKVGGVIENLKRLMNDKINEADAYRLSQIDIYVNDVNDLQSWIYDSIKMFVDAKPKHGIMIGDSRALDKNNFSELTSLYEQFFKELPNRVDQFEGIGVKFNDISLKEEISELEEISNQKSNLDQLWANLDLITEEFKDLIDKTQNWYHQHDSLYNIEDNFGKLEDRINGLNSIGYDNLEGEIKELDEKVKTSKLMLDEAKSKANQIFNRLLSSFHIALTTTHNASLFAALYAEVNRITENCYEEIVTIKSRHEDLENGGYYYTLNVNSLETTINNVIDKHSESDEVYRKYDRQLHICLKKEMDKLMELKPVETKKNHIINIFNKAKLALNQFSDAIALEYNEIELLRNVHNHAKTAHEIIKWINSCSLAVASKYSIDREALEEKNQRFSKCHLSIQKSKL